MTVAEALDYCSEAIEKNGIDEADFKAKCLVSTAAEISNSQLLFSRSKELDGERLDAMLQRLLDGEPLQYIIGKWDFYESEFTVGEGVLIPRPETEELVEKAVDYISKLGECIVFDLCAGSGCIGLSVAKACPSSQVYLIEKSEAAFRYLRLNSKGVSNARIILADICDDIELPEADVIISNPPYIKSSDIDSLQSEVRREPIMALDGGSDGLDFYRIINDRYASKLKDNGVLFLEIGNEQGESVKSLLKEFRKVSVTADMYGNDRIVIANK